MKVLGMKRQGNPWGRGLRAAALAACWASAAAAGSPATAVPAAEEAVFARVGERVVFLRDYESLLAATMRRKFYHGQVPEGQLAALRQEVADTVVERVLLLDEAKRRGIAPEQAKVKQAVDGYEARYAASPMWQQNRERLLPGLIAQLEQQSVLEQLENAVRAAPEPTAGEVRDYFLRHPEKFTEPAKIRLSMILLRVEPSSPAPAWEQAREEAAAIHRRLVQGADFGELARLHSADASAARGGALGYLHRGMLPEALQQKVDQFREGVVAEPLTLLEGVAIFRLDERVPAKLRPFEEVRTRAAELARRDWADAAWKELIAALRSRIPIRIEAPGFAAPGAAGQPTKPE